MALKIVFSNKFFEAKLYYCKKGDIFEESFRLLAMLTNCSPAVIILPDTKCILMSVEYGIHILYFMLYSVLDITR